MGFPHTPLSLCKGVVFNMLSRASVLVPWQLFEAQRHRGCFIRLIAMRGGKRKTSDKQGDIGACFAERLQECEIIGLIREPNR